MKKILGMVFGLLLCSCANHPEAEQETPEVSPEKILIQFFPSFHSASLVLWDSSKDEISFQRIGSKVYYERMTYPHIEKRTAPLSINIKPDSLTSKYLKDSLNFTESDYKDVHVDMCDGILNTILLINSDGSIIDVNTNNVSDNQRKLITYLLSNLIYEHPDSLSRSYLLALKRYY